jgi:hypothetical protein
MRWAAACCQRTTELVVHALRQQGLDIVVYIDDFAGVASSEQQAAQHFAALQSMLRHLGLEEAAHKACPPRKRLTWLGLVFDSEAMSVSIPQAKLQEVQVLVKAWSTRSRATLHSLRELLGKLLYVAQCSPPARLFLNRLLKSLRECPAKGTLLLSPDFRKDLKWFAAFLPQCNGVFIIQPTTATQHHVYVDSCLSGAGALLDKQAYAMQYPAAIIDEQHPICHLEALNCMLALKLWGPQLAGKKVSLHCDSATAVAVLQAGRGRDEYIQQCAREIWLVTARYDIDLSVHHVAGEQLTASADALSRCHLGAPYQQRVDGLERAGVQLSTPDPRLLEFSPLL